MQTRLHGENKGPMQRVMWKPHHTLQIKRKTVLPSIVLQIQFLKYWIIYQTLFPKWVQSYKSLLPDWALDFSLLQGEDLTDSCYITFESSINLTPWFWEAMAISQRDNILNKWEFGLDTAFSMQCELHSNILLPVWDFSLVRYSKNRKH